MFRGLHGINVDDKGRIAIPTRYREEVASEANGRVIVTIDTEQPCLLLYLLPEWEIIEKKIEALPSFNPAARRIQRLLIGHATEIEADSHGRILLPAPLREYAHLNKAVMLVGQGRKFEIWNEEQWNTTRKQWLEIGTACDSLPPELQILSL
jgi:MraZ protein